MHKVQKKTNIYYFCFTFKNREDIQPINNGDGPQYNPEGKADVTSSLAGSYSITADDIRRPLREEKQKRRL